MQKYNIGDHVMYGVSGACQIVEIGPLEFGGPDKIYYSLKPVYDARDTIYVPVTREEEISRKVMGKKKAQETVKQIEKSKMSGQMPDRETCDVILQNADSVEVANLIRHLRNVRAINKKNHKSLNITDAKYLTYAERIVKSELSVALSITMDESEAMLNAALG